MAVFVRAACGLAANNRAVAACRLSWLMASCALWRIWASVGVTGGDVPGVCLGVSVVVW